MINIEKQGAVSVMRPRGPLKDELLDTCRSKVEPLVHQGRPQVVMDLSETVLLDSAALQWLLELDAACGYRGGGFCVSNANGLCGEILSITGVGSQLQICADVKAALGRFAQ